MGWFEEQIKQRKKYSDDAFEEAFYKVADAVTGKNVAKAMQNDAKRTEDAIEAVLKYYKIKSTELPPEIKNVYDQIDYLTRPNGMMRRDVYLTKGWYKDAYGAMLGTLKSDGTLVALIPSKFGGYTYYDTKNQKIKKINSNNEHLIDNEAIAFYKQFPLRQLNMYDLLRFALQSLSITDYIFYGLLTLIGVLLGILVVNINKILLSDVLISGNLKILIACSIFLICTKLSSLIFNLAKSLYNNRINAKMNVSIKSATMMRILSLPPSFFKKYSSGNLSSRTAYINLLCTMLTSAIFNIGFEAIFSLTYITQIVKFAPMLVIPSIIITTTTFLFSLLSTVLTIKVSKQKMELKSQENGMNFAIINGIKKIKLAGAEKIVFSKWANLYSKEARLEYNPPLFIKFNVIISTTIGLISTIIMYYFSVKSGVSVSDYYAFNSAYGFLSGAFMSIAGMAITFANIKPIMEMANPILEAKPELTVGKQVITKLSGRIEIDNLSFRYNDNMPYVLDDLSLKIKPGQYVAIVGASGCGKSTLMRLLLGFETTDKGAIYYDGKDINTIELRSLRRKIGVVMQNGSLFTGDIYSNIVISAPELTIEDAWEAAEQSGIADDIKKMPMGMHTLISEGSGGISGGQKQRLMIARAIAPKPKILMFDEATSALDNITQKIVSDSLAKLKCTRIVIAHRLSTIKECDRIIVLDKGKIIEDGTYDELLKNNGFFKELVERQQIEE